MKNIFLISSFIVILLFSSCNFNITDIPGPQISTNIKSAKSHGTFICAFTPNGKKLNGSEMKSIFAEKKYFLNEGFFGRFDIDCCESQLVIIYNGNDYVETLNDIPQNWEVVGFFPSYTGILMKSYKGSVFPDSIPIKIIPDVKKPDSIEMLTLYKVK